LQVSVWTPGGAAVVCGLMQEALGSGALRESGAAMSSGWASAAPPGCLWHKQSRIRAGSEGNSHTEHKELFLVSHSAGRPNPLQFVCACGDL